MMSNDFYIPALQSEKHSTNQWGGVPQWVCPAFIYRLQVVQVTKITSERLDLRILLKQNLKAKVQNVYIQDDMRTCAGRAQAACWKQIKILLYNCTK